MDDREGRNVQRSSQTLGPHLPRSYNLLIQLSKKMGTIATNSSIVHDVRSFMNQEIGISPSEKLLGTIPKLTVARTGEADTQPTDVKNQDSDNGNRSGPDKSLRAIASRSHEVLMTANTVFPMTLFPDTVTVDRTKVTITRRDFFWSSDVLSIRIEDVLNVEVSVGPLFGSLTVASRVMSTTDHFQIKHLWRSDAMRLKRIIQGYVIAQHNNIDTSHLDKKELIETLMELGHDAN